MLNRVSYTRVFDLAGVVEAVDEVAKSWEAQAQQKNKTIKARPGVIEDSEEEEEEEEEEDKGEGEGDETNQSLLNENDQNTLETTDQQAGGQDGMNTQEIVSIDMIVIDTIANVVSSVMSKSQVQGKFFIYLNTTYAATSHQPSTI